MDDYGGNYIQVRDITINVIVNFLFRMGKEMVLQSTKRDIEINDMYILLHFLLTNRKFFGKQLIEMKIKK